MVKRQRTKQQIELAVGADRKSDRGASTSSITRPSHHIAGFSSGDSVDLSRCLVVAVAALTLYEKACDAVERHQGRTRAGQS